MKTACRLGLAPSYVIYLLAVAVLLAMPEAAGHPGYENVSLEIRIDDEMVLYTLKVAEDHFYGGILESDYLKDKESLEASKAAIEQFFHENNTVKIDGVRVRPVVQNLERATHISGLFRLVNFHLVYATKGRAKEVSMAWTTYPETFSDGTKAALQQNARLLAAREDVWIVFTAKEPEYIWHGTGRSFYRKVLAVSAVQKRGTLSLPVVPISILAGWGITLLALGFAKPGGRTKWIVSVAGLAAVMGTLPYGGTEVEIPWQKRLKKPDAERARAIFETLHKNIYRAFDYNTESDIYDTLARSVDGELLDSIYNDVYQGLILEGGAVCRIQSVEILKSQMEEPLDDSLAGAAAFRMRSRWRVNGLVRHWSHTHARTNEYEAIYTIAPREENWKIVGTEMLDMQRGPDVTDDRTG